MLALRRRARVEGWALDVSEAESESSSAGFVQRLAENNRLWIISLVLVLALAGAFAKTANKAGHTRSGRRAARPSYDPAAQAGFAAGFAKSKSFGFPVTEARFVGPRSFRMVLPANISADDIDYVSKIAALKILARFHHRVVVYAYVAGSGGAGERLIATTKWDPDKHGYVAKLHSAVPPP